MASNDYLDLLYVLQSARRKAEDYHGDSERGRAIIGLLYAAISVHIKASTVQEMRASLARLSAN